MTDGARAEPAASAARTTFPCPQCGAILYYLPGTDQIQCRHCGHQSAIRPVGTPIRELDYQAALAALELQAPGEDQPTQKCDGCAAEFTFEPGVHAGTCPYCGSTIVTDPGVNRLIRPQALVPFALAEADARERLKAWLRSLWFAPSGVKQYARGEGAMTGVYVPHWTFDAATESSYVGQRGTVYQEPQTVMVRVHGKMVRQQRMVSRIRWSPARGRVGRRFDDVLVLASRTLPYDLTSALTPWLQQTLKPYQEEYLSGFRSEAYQLDLGAGFELATRQMAQVIRSDVTRDIGGDAQRIHEIDTRYGEISFKLILLPVWVAAYRYRGKTYQFVVNGQTGEVQGERPYSPLKIALAVLIGLLLLAVVLVLAAQGGLLEDAWDGGFEQFFDESTRWIER
jgi:DNA-directed RNA polymerase subunit RPC12/RpoP